MIISFLTTNVVPGVTPTAWNFQLSQSDYYAFQNTFYGAQNGVYGIDIFLHLKSGAKISIAYNQWSLMPTTPYYLQITNANSLGIGISDVIAIEYKLKNDSGGSTNDTFIQGTIIQQPGGTSGLRIMAAYRPIVFDVEFMEKPPVTYCDIYFGGIYYKTLSKTTPENSNIYRFDISDACQEYLSSELAPINSNSLNIPSKYFVECFCRFRTSKYDSNGFISQEKIIPVQGTSSNAPVEGGGKQSLTFYVLNAVLQHENNQNFQKHLKSIPHLEITETPESKNTLPLTHRPIEYKICVNDSDFYPIVTCYTPKKINLQVKLKDGTVIDLTKELPQNGYNSNNPIGCDII